MKRITRKLVITAAILVVVYLVYLAYWSLTKAMTSDEADLNVLIVDIQEKFSLDQSDVLVGSEPFLAYLPEQAESNNPIIISFENLTQIIKFGDDNNGYIDQSNPYFPHFCLVLSQPNHDALNCFSLKEAGFGAIAFEPDFVFAAKQGNLKKFAEQIGNLVQLDGQRVMLKMVAVNRMEFEELINQTNVS